MKYCVPVRFFLERYTTDDVITETDIDMMRSTQEFNKSPK